jgi:hypothetical protein
MSCAIMIGLTEAPAFALLQLSVMPICLPESPAPLDVFLHTAMRAIWDPCTNCRVNRAMQHRRNRA